MTERIKAAARALCRVAAADAELEYNDCWSMYGEQFTSDAKVALEAADAVQPIIVDKRIKRLESLVRSYRDKERKRREKSVQQVQGGEVLGQVLHHQGSTEPRQAAS